MKRPTRSMGGASIGNGKVVSSRTTPYDVFVEGRWYTPASVTPTVTPTPTPTPSSISENPVSYILVQVTAPVGEYWGGQVTATGVAYDQYGVPVSLAGKTVVWAEEQGYEGTVTIQNQVDEAFSSSVQVSPTGVATGSAIMWIGEYGSNSLYVYQSTVIELTPGDVCSPLNPSSYYRRGDMIVGTILYTDFSCTTPVSAGSYVEESVPTNRKYTVDGSGEITDVEDCI